MKPPEQKHQRAEERLEVVVLIDVTLIIQLDVSKHLQETGTTIILVYFIGSSLASTMCPSLNQE